MSEPATQELSLPARALALPVTVVSVLAAAMVYFFAGGGGIDMLVLDTRAFEGQPFRAFTSALVHGGVWGDESASFGMLHLSFNAFWLVILGAQLEAHWGHVRYAVFVILVAMVSNLAEFALFSTPVGLSGVVYGVAAARWWLTKRGARGIAPLPERTAQFLAFWFALCIVLTVTDLMAVANVAHGVGALSGALLASLATIGSLSMRLATGVVCSLVALSAAYAAGPARPIVNMAAHGGSDHMRLGLRALSAKDYVGAEARFKQATAFRNCPPEAWHNLGVARSRQGKFASAANAFKQASANAPGEPSFKRAYEQAKAAVAATSAAAE